MSHRTTELQAAFWAGQMAATAGRSFRDNPYRRPGTLAPAPPVDVAAARLWRSGFDRARAQRT